MFKNYRKKSESTKIASTETSVKKPLTIYITHGNALIVKMTAKRFYNSEHQLIATYSADEDQYRITNIAAINAYGIQIDDLPLSQDSLIKLINQIKQHSSVNSAKTRLICDANLGTVAGHNVTPLLRSLIDQIQPTSLIPITETPECVKNAGQELSISISTHQTITANIIKDNENEFLALPPQKLSNTTLNHTTRTRLFGCCFIFRTNAASISDTFKSDQPTNSRIQNQG